RSGLSFIGALLHRRQIFDWKHHALVLISYVKNLRNRRSLLLPLRGFTLAEVLITLGIIGVVATLTIPTLIQNNTKKVTATKVHKVFSNLNNAIKLSESINGPMKDWSMASYTNENLGNEESILNDTEKILETYIVPYFKLTKCGTGNFVNNSELLKKCGPPVSSVGATYSLPDGTAISFVAKNGKFYALLTINFHDNINDYVSGRDWFYFTGKDGKILPYGWSDGISREALLTNGVEYDGETIACNVNPSGSLFGDLNRYGCTALLMLDSWEFKNDYPW
ncbi:type II secretion system protein, partial [bacterium]|nr:type II secretion system protein [bacterium]